MNLTTKPKRHIGRWIAATAVIAALSTWYLGLEPSKENRKLTQAVDSNGLKAETAPVTDADSGALAADGASGGYAARLEGEGWRPADAPAPDASLVNLDPSLIPSREEEIQRTLQSNSFEGKQLDKVAEIARRTENRKTRILALEALADSDDARAQKLMTELYRDPKFDGESREQILGSLRPTSPSDDVTSFLLEEIRSQENSEGTKIQALAPLVVMNLMNEHTKPNAEILAKLPPNARKRYLDMYRVMLSGEDPEVPESWSGEAEEE